MDLSEGATIPSFMHSLATCPASSRIRRGNGLAESGCKAAGGQARSPHDETAACSDVKEEAAELQLQQDQFIDLKLPASMQLVKARRPATYRECLKNHAACVGGRATDGCGEFMPSGNSGTLEALKCAACGCHRNFHRREATDVSPLPHALVHSMGPLSHYIPAPPAAGRTAASPEFDGVPSRIAVFLPPSSDVRMKRFRTKFTAEQKELMCEFAEKLGWRMQKQDDAEVQEFCERAGIKRRVLKVWMHNNKNTLGKKLSSTAIAACTSSAEEEEGEATNAKIETQSLE